MMEKLLTPKNDYVFKKLFTQDTEILADLINSVLQLSGKEKIRSVEVKNPGILPEDITKKRIVLDIHAVDDAGREYDIEMQVRKYDSHPDRALYYLCKMFADQLKSGQEYGKLNPVIGIHFLDYRQFPDHKDFRYSFLLRDTRYPELRFTEKLAIHVFELPGIEKAMSERKNDPSIEWLDFFNHGNEQEEDAMKAHYANPKIRKAYDLLKTMSADEETRFRAETREKALINEAILMAGEREKGRKEGEKEGRKEQAQETALMMLAKGMDINLIAEVTKLDIKDVEKLKTP